ncbi:MAG: hypothetical protein V2A54_16795 [Bacteroidota bacterium]
MGQNPFSKYNFESGNYTIYGRKEINTKNKLALTLGDFYTNNIGFLNAFKNEWNFESRSSVECVCNFDYFITIVKSDSIVDEIAISLSCNRAIFDINNEYCFYFRFDSSKVLMNTFNLLIREEKKFNDITKARVFWADIKDSKNIFAPLREEFYWYKFDGSFEFQFNDSLKENNWVKTKTYLKSTFENKLMTNNFHLEYFRKVMPGNIKEPDTYYVTVFCNSDFAKKFNIFEKEKEWTPIKNIFFEIYYKN